MDWRGVMEGSTTTRDGFEVVTFGGEVIHFVPCAYDHDTMRERVMMGLLRNMRDDCFVRDTRDAGGES
jgi:hypothetical protein